MRGLILVASLLLAASLLSAWGYSAVEFSGQSEEPGMGTQAAERERSRRGMGEAGQSLRSTLYRAPSTAACTGA